MVQKAEERGARGDFLLNQWSFDEFSIRFDSVGGLFGVAAMGAVQIPAWISRGGMIEAEFPMGEECIVEFQLEGQILVVGLAGKDSAGRVGVEERQQSQGLQAARDEQAWIGQRIDDGLQGSFGVDERGAGVGIVLVNDFPKSPETTGFCNVRGELEFRIKLAGEEEVDGALCLCGGLPQSVPERGGEFDGLTEDDVFSRVQSLLDSVSDNFRI